MAESKFSTITLHFRRRSTRLDQWFLIYLGQLYHPSDLTNCFFNVTLNKKVENHNAAFDRWCLAASVCLGLVSMRMEKSLFGSMD